MFYQEPLQLHDHEKETEAEHPTPVLGQSVAQIHEPDLHPQPATSVENTHEDVTGTADNSVDDNLYRTDDESIEETSKPSTVIFSNDHSRSVSISRSNIELKDSYLGTVTKAHAKKGKVLSSFMEESESSNESSGEAYDDKAYSTATNAELNASDYKLLYYKPSFKDSSVDATQSYSSHSRFQQSPSMKSMPVVSNSYQDHWNRDMGLDNPPYRVSHTWKTQAKVTGTGKDHTVVTVPCDGKNNLLGVTSIPMKSPLPPGILEEPIMPSQSKSETTRNHKGDFIEERTASRVVGAETSPTTREQFLEMLQEQKARVAKEKLLAAEEIQVFDEPMNEEEDEGVIMYEEDSNDGLDRKLQEFDDTEEEEEEEEEQVKDVGHDLNDDALNGNLSNSLGNTRDLHTINEQSSDDGGEGASSEENIYNEVDSNANFNPKNSRYNLESDADEKEQDTTDERTIEEGDSCSGLDNSANLERKDRNLTSSETRNSHSNTAGNVAWIVDGGGGIGATGTVFHLRLVGSVEVSEENVGGSGLNANTIANTTKRPRKEMVTEAVSKLKVSL